MSAAKNNLIWLDLEMTGRDPDFNRIIELATIVTDEHLNIIAEGPVLAVYQTDEHLSTMDDWNTRQHNQSGLVSRVKASIYNESLAEAKTLSFLQQHVPAGASPLCGNSICLDKRFLIKYMPKLANFFHYRMIDVSSLKELAKRWHPRLINSLKKDSKHLALDDIKDSIAELKFYREHFIKLGD
jgi:oligoribonuclease